MATSWRCPIPGCTTAITESVPMVEALVISYARARHGELPDPVALAELRRDRVTALLDDHIDGHAQVEIDDWLARSCRV